MIQSEDIRIAVIGLGYVGLPLGLALARHFTVLGYDSDSSRVEDLDAAHDRTGEVSADELTGAPMRFTADTEALKSSNVFIVTVPTPIDKDNEPDLSALISVSETLGRVIDTGAVIVYESTVFPGATEDICGPAVEAASGLKSGRDFFLGYSPERINPGDREHTVEKISKVVAGQTAEVTALLEHIYGTALHRGVFVAENIKTAEAAKVIENAQRDINIAFINEAAMIFQRMGIDTQQVLAAARTKWNFLDFQPGLVGGHCIGVDPFYLAHAARQFNHDPEIILAGRRINDGMAAFVAEQIDDRMDGVPGRVLILGLTFKENVTDLRNSKVVDLVKALQAKGHDVAVHDTMADIIEAQELYGLELLDHLPGKADYDALIGAVPHDAYRRMDAPALQALTRPGGLIADLKNIWQDLDFGDHRRRWVL